MLSNIKTERLIDKGYANIPWNPNKRKFGEFDECLDQKIKVEIKEEINYDIKPEIKEKPIPKMKDNIRDPRLTRRLQSCPASIYGSDIRPVEVKQDICDTASTTVTSFDSVLQQIFQWSPEWLQGRATNKPPLQKFDTEMKKNEYKYEYTPEEYISRQLPYILSGLFMKLSDTFKNEAPMRVERQIMVNQCENFGHLNMNKLLECYAFRDIRHSPKPVAKVNDIITITISVKQGNKGMVVNKKKYFALVTGHSMLELNEMEHKMPQRNNKFMQDRVHTICDRLTIVTKRALNSYIMPQQFGEMDILMNANLEIKLIQNLLDSRLRTTKLFSNIITANANIHQFSEEDLNEIQSVRQVLSTNAEDMIKKSSPLLFFKGICNLMAIDMNNDDIRFKCLCDIVKSVNENIGKIRFLVITQNSESAAQWRNRIRNIRGNTKMKVWNIDPDYSWATHHAVKTFVLKSGVKGLESCETKLKNMKQSDDSYDQIFRRKDVFEKLIDNTKVKSIQIPAVHIARQEFSDRGFENQLKDVDIVIGSLAEVVNYRHLMSGKPFDCCIIDNCHLLSDVHVMSVLHFGVKCMIIAGDTDHKPISEEALLNQYNYNTSLFERVFQKMLNSF